MDGYEKTQHLQLNKIGKKNIADILAVSENFELLDEKIGNINFDEQFKEVNKKIDGIELKDTNITCTSCSNKKLNTVLGEIAYKFNVLPIHIKGNDPSSGGEGSIITFVEILSDYSFKVKWVDRNGSHGEAIHTPLKTLVISLNEIDKQLQEKTNSIETELNGKVDRLAAKNNNIDEELAKVKRLLGR